MTERLIIRLASKASQKIYWLIWSDSENEVIASGSLDDAEQLSLLSENAQQRVVICLLPSVDVVIKKIAINGVFNRQMRQALPYLAEDELASDVDTLHFSIVDKETGSVHVAICEKQKISMWLSCLESAQICCRQFIPEGLALPIGEDGTWKAVLWDKQWIVRESFNCAWSCEQELLDTIITSKSNEHFIPQIESYSPSIENKVGNWIDLPSVLAMEVFAKGTQNNKINLLTGPFKPKKENHGQLDKWRIPAILGVLVFIFMMLNVYLKNLQVEKDISLVKQHVEAVYQQAFPTQSKLKYARIKKKLKSMLVGVDGDAQSGFLRMLNELVPAFEENPKFQANSIKFDSKKQEMQISASADNFQLFESFNAALPDYFQVDQGALNSSKNGVSGLLTIRIKE